jgi:hypothetical protein
LLQHNQQNQAASATQPLLQRDRDSVLLAVMCKDILNVCVKIFHLYGSIWKNTEFEILVHVHEIKSTYRNVAVLNADTLRVANTT